MKIKILILFLSLCILSFSQTRELRSFNFQGHEIDYSRIDYSKYGIAHFFITMYSTDSEYNLIEQSAYNCLLKEDNLYHTLFFFVRVPPSIKDLDIKSLLFSEFVNLIKREENIEKVNLYLNFDEDCSKIYQMEKKLENANDVKRVIKNISVKNICKNLTVSLQ
ncbi:hypothetical protein [Litoribaculum gwangyangense]|uniref:Uncharacterized protein n=1 Tax=Litoribaculum gwangyangense TaxID=1130722 RepID=A0ABP9BWI9_9FLAO